MKKINTCFFILLLLFTQVILTDNMIYFLNFSYLGANIIAFVVNVAIATVLIKKGKIEIETNFNKFDIVFIILLLFITITSISYGDTSWDTYSYHLYLQENPFADKIYDDYFPGRTLTSFVFPIADRVFYMFRLALGYRLGTSIGYFLLLVLFYQVKKMLRVFLEGKLSDNYISLLSIIPVCLFIIFDELGTYYIDNFTLVVLMEIFYITVAESKELVRDKAKLFYLLYIVGICITVKITTIAYLMIPFFVILIRNFKYLKEIKLRYYLAMIALVFIPMLPYLVDCVKQTGSPVYPYYNTIFQSEYFSDENWLDTRFGPSNLKQILLYPFYLINNPGMAFEKGNVDPVWYYGYLLVILCGLWLIYKKVIKKEKIDKAFMIYIITLLGFYLVWAKFVIGYARYGGVIPVLATILIIKLFVESVINRRYVAILILGAMLANSLYCSYNQYSVYNYDVIENITSEDETLVQKAKSNLSKLFVDRTNDTYDIDGIWGAVYDDSGIPTLIRTDDPIVHLEYGVKTAPNELTNALWFNLVLNNDIYVPMFNYYFYAKLANLEDNNFEVVAVDGFMTNVSFLDDPDYILVVKVEYNESAKNIRQTIDVETTSLTRTIDSQNIKIKAIVGINPSILGYIIDGATLEVVGISGEDEYVIDTLRIAEGNEYINYENEISDNIYDTIQIRLVDVEGDNIDDNSIMVLNYEVEAIE